MFINSIHQSTFSPILGKEPENKCYKSRFKKGFEKIKVEGINENYEMEAYPH